MSSNPQPLERTDRGFAIYGTLTDSVGSLVCVQESSVVGRPACWVFCHSPDPEYTNPHPQLTAGQARELIAALERFVAHAQSEDNWRNAKDYNDTYG